MKSNDFFIDFRNTYINDSFFMYKGLTSKLCIIFKYDANETKDCDCFFEFFSIG